MPNSKSTELKKKLPSLLPNQKDLWTKKKSFGTINIFQEKYDLIIEQTFLSALHPSMRNEYAKQMSKLLNPGGKLVGVIFGVEMFHDHPPYGGNITDYKTIFEPYFEFNTFEPATNSIPPRMGNELFLILEKK